VCRARATQDCTGPALTSGRASAIVDAPIAMGRGTRPEDSQPTPAAAGSVATPLDGDSMKKTSSSSRGRQARTARQQSIEGRRIRCYRCWAAGTFVRRNEGHGPPWPPWYVEWVRAPLPPATKPSILIESQSAPMAHSYCPGCRTKPRDPANQVRNGLLVWAAASSGSASA
jgi:hypothetical protein